VHVFHAIPHAGLSMVGPIHYPSIHHCRRGEGSSNLATIKASKFAGHLKSHMRHYIIKLVHRGQTMGP
jgi:hypothetical protein